MQRDEIDPPRDNEFRDIVLKSGFTGVAATVLVVAICSPAGLGGMIGTSVASSLGFGAKSNADANTLHFSSAPSPLSTTELATIHQTLESSEAQIDNIRAATDSEIQYMRDIATAGHIALAAPAAVHAAAASAHPSVVASATFDPHLELAALLLPEQDTHLESYQD